MQYNMYSIFFSTAAINRSKNRHVIEFTIQCYNRPDAADELKKNKYGFKAEGRLRTL